MRYNINPTKVGIYSITCLATGNQYIGSTKRLAKRKAHHFWQLSHHTHTKQIQEEYDLYGREAFQFRVLCYCDPEMLEFYEQRFVEFLHPVYNRTLTGKSGGPLTQDLIGKEFGNLRVLERIGRIDRHYYYLVEYIDGKYPNKVTRVDNLTSGDSTGKRSKRKEG